MTPYRRVGRARTTTPNEARIRYHRASLLRGVLSLMVISAGVATLVTILTTQRLNINSGPWLLLLAVLAANPAAQRARYWRGWLDRHHTLTTIWADAATRQHEPADVGYHELTDTPERACTCGDPNCDWITR